MGIIPESMLWLFTTILAWAQVGKSLIPSSMANDTACFDLGYDDVSPYQYNLKLSSLYYSQEIGNIFLPIFTSSSLDRLNENITQVVIAVHGYMRDADSTFCSALAASSSLDNVLVISPWFGSEQVSGDSWASTGLSSDLSAYWSSSAWMSGGDSSIDPSNYTSSFYGLDKIITTVTETGYFPSIERISVAGFSAGGQTVQRYSWATSIADASSNNDVKWELRFIMSDPNSYLYLDGNRPSSDCILLENTGANLTCSSFVQYDDNNSCSEFDEWKYGVGSFPNSGYTYLEKFGSDASTIESQTNLLRHRDIRFLFGEEDVCNCNEDGFVNDDTCFESDATCSPNEYGGDYCCDTYPDSTGNDISITCGAMLQGSNRLQRGLVYMSYLESLWASHKYSAKYNIISGMKHHSKMFYFSEQFSEWGFGQSAGDSSAVDSLTRGEEGAIDVVDIVKEVHFHTILLLLLGIALLLMFLTSLVFNSASSKHMSSYQFHSAPKSHWFDSSTRK